MRRIGRLVVTAALAAVLGCSAGGCSALDALGFNRPSARLVGVGLDDVDLNGLTVRFDVDVTNPYPTALPLVNADYALASDGATFLSGEAPLEGTVPAGGTRTLQLPARVTFRELVSAASGVKLGSVIPYEADLGLSVTLPADQKLRLPLSRSGTLPVPAPPAVELQRIEWDRVTVDAAGGTLHLKVTNRNEFPLDLARMAYELTLGETKVASASVATAAHFDPGGTGALALPVSLSPRQLGLAVLGMLTGDRAHYNLTGAADVRTPFGPLNLPFSGTGVTRMLR